MAKKSYPTTDFDTTLLNFLVITDFITVIVNFDIGMHTPTSRSRIARSTQ